MFNTFTLLSNFWVFIIVPLTIWFYNIPASRVTKTTKVKQ